MRVSISAHVRARATVDRGGCDDDDDEDDEEEVDEEEIDDEEDDEDAKEAVDALVSSIAEEADTCERISARRCARSG